MSAARVCHARASTGFVADGFAASMNLYCCPRPSRPFKALAWAGTREAPRAGTLPSRFPSRRPWRMDGPRRSSLHGARELSIFVQANRVTIGHPGRRFVP